MNWYKRIKLSKGWGKPMERRMPETPEQLYDYYHSDDEPYRREEYMDYKAREMAKPPIEMSGRERANILEPEPEDRSEIDYKIDRALEFIKSKEGEINSRLISKYWHKFPNLPEYYILNYLRKKGFNFIAS